MVKVCFTVADPDHAEELIKLIITDGFLYMAMPLKIEVCDVDEEKPDA